MLRVLFQNSLRSNMFKATIILLTVLSVSLCDRRIHQPFIDPFAAFDQHFSQTFAQQALWPFGQLIKAAAALQAEDRLEEPHVVSDREKLQINIKVQNFQPDELKVRVKNRNIIIEGKHKVKSEGASFMANHFVQKFVLPQGSKQEEVTATLKENGVLSVDVPKHELPPPLPEREVPIKVLLPIVPEENTEAIYTTTTTTVKDKEIEKVEKTTTEKKEPVATSSATPLEQLDLVEATTHVGKIRKKELKDTVKTTKDNEVPKGGMIQNGLDYSESE